MKLYSVYYYRKCFIRRTTSEDLIFYFITDSILWWYYVSLITPHYSSLTHYKQRVAIFNLYDKYTDTEPLTIFEQKREIMCA